MYGAPPLTIQSPLSQDGKDDFGVFVSSQDEMKRQKTEKIAIITERSLFFKARKF